MKTTTIAILLFAFCVPASAQVHKGIPQSVQNILTAIQGLGGSGEADSTTFATRARTMQVADSLGVLIMGKQAAGDYATNTALSTGLSGKANTTHSHAISEVTSLQTTLDGKQDDLVSGTNIKTVGGVTLLGAGDIPFPSGTNYKNLVQTSADVVNNNATANTLADVTGLSFSVTAGTRYRFYALIPYTSAATTTGARFTVNGPASPTVLAYTSTYSLTATTQTVNYAAAYGIPAASNASSLLTGNVAIIQGVIQPSASGTVAIQFASEIAGSAITVKAGATLEWW